MCIVSSCCMIERSVLWYFVSWMVCNLSIGDCASDTGRVKENEYSFIALLQLRWKEY